eukprot:4175813-Prymnesium_polylepis.1
MEGSILASRETTFGWSHSSGECSTELPYSGRDRGWRSRASADTACFHSKTQAQRHRLCGSMSHVAHRMAEIASATVCSHPHESSWSSECKQRSATEGMQAAPSPREMIEGVPARSWHWQPGLILTARGASSIESLLVLS